MIQCLLLVDFSLDRMGHKPHKESLRLDACRQTIEIMLRDQVAYGLPGKTTAGAHHIQKALGD